jgi:hypothetical protein
MTTEVGQLIGLVAAAAVYGAATMVTPVALFARIRRLPANWHGHPEVRDFYARRLGPQPLFPPRRGIYSTWFIVTAVLFGAFSVIGPSLSIELGFCAIVAGIMTASTATARKMWSSRWASALGLEAAAVDSFLRPVYCGGLFVTYGGLLGIACFLGGSVGVLL